MEVNFFNAATMDSGLCFGQPLKDGKAVALYALGKFRLVEDGSYVMQMAMLIAFRRLYLEQRCRQRAAHDAFLLNAPATRRQPQSFDGGAQLLHGPPSIDQTAQKHVAGNSRRHIDIGDHTAKQITHGDDHRVGAGTIERTAAKTCQVKRHKTITRCSETLDNRFVLL